VVGLARNAEAVFIQSPNLAAAARDTADIRSRAVRHGRLPDDIKFFQGRYVVPGSAEEEARRTAAELDEWIDYDAQLAHMPGAVGIDFGHHTATNSRIVGTPEQIGLRRPRRAGPAAAGPDAAGVRGRHAPPQAVRTRRPAARTAPRRPLSRRLRAAASLKDQP
jgi:hypothetical protein